MTDAPRQLQSQASRCRQCEAARHGVRRDGWGASARGIAVLQQTWRSKYHLNGKREKITIGGYPAFTVKQARDRDKELRAFVERGQSPTKAKRAVASEQKLASITGSSLDDAFCGTNIVFASCEPVFGKCAPSVTRLTLLDTETWSELEASFAAVAGAATEWRKQNQDCAAS